MDVAIPIERKDSVTKVDGRIQVIFKDLEYSVPVKVNKKNTEKVILRGINGVFQPGKLTVIMGASGAGKTSLLNVIAGDYGAGSVRGNVLVNGQQLSTSKMKAISGFVFQDDLILETMTVREAITMSAQLRLPNSMSLEEKTFRVNDIISLLQLGKAADTIVGNSTVKGISGGERKRTSMAMEMVTNPSVIFLDEPTSGLDTYTAFSVMKCLKELAQHGRTVIATIHQPSSEIFHLFDDLILLAAGQVIYQGDCSKVVPYFGEKGFQCPQYTNPADYIFMSILNSDAVHDKLEESPAVRIQRLQQAWLDSEENKALLSGISDTSVYKELNVSSFKKPSNFMTQFKFLFKRAGKNAWRNKLIIRIKFAQAIVIGLIVGLIYLDVGRSETLGLQDQVQNRMGSLFFLVVNMFMLSATGVLSIFATEKFVFMREYSSGYYSLPAYFLSKTLVELPFQVLFPIVLVSIEYWMIGFQNIFYKYVIMALVAVLVCLCGMAFGTLSACAFNDLPVALAIFPLFFLPLMMFSGLFVNLQSIPEYFKWIKHISPMKYGFVTLMKNEFNGLIFKGCDSNLPSCRGESIIKMQNMTDELDIEWNLLILFFIYIGLLFLACLALYRILRKSNTRKK